MHPGATYTHYATLAQYVTCTQHVLRARHADVTAMLHAWQGPAPVRMAALLVPTFVRGTTRLSWSNVETACGAPSWRRNHLAAPASCLSALPAQRQTGYGCARAASSLTFARGARAGLNERSRPPYDACASRRITLTRYRTVLRPPFWRTRQVGRVSASSLISQ